MQKGKSNGIRGSWQQGSSDGSDKSVAIHFFLAARSISMLIRGMYPETSFAIR